MSARASFTKNAIDQLHGDIEMVKPCSSQRLYLPVSVAGEAESGGLEPGRQGVIKNFTDRVDRVGVIDLVHLFMAFRTFYQIKKRYCMSTLTSS